MKAPHRKLHDAGLDLYADALARTIAALSWHTPPTCAEVLAALGELSIPADHATYIVSYALTRGILIVSSDTLLAGPSVC